MIVYGFSAGVLCLWEWFMCFLYLVSLSSWSKEHLLGVSACGYQRCILGISSLTKRMGE